MKLYTPLLCFALTLTSLASMAQSKTFTHKISNTSNSSKHDVPVVIDLHKTKGVKWNVKSATVSLNGKSVPCQLDDLDGDTKYDELAFLVDIDKNTTNNYTITLSTDKPQQSFSPRTWGALILSDKKSNLPPITSLEAPGKSYLFNDVYMHGAVLESELVGWRLYFDQRQNLDLYGKHFKRLEIEETQFYTSVEQLNAGYGVDVLWAGGAVGCGTFRGWNGAPTLLENVDTRGQRLVAQGPVRTIVEMKDLGWRIKGDEEEGLNMTQRYTQWAGHRDLEVTVSFDRPLGDELFCVGVQKVGETATDSVRQGHRSQGFIEKGIAASWGCDYPDMGKKQMWPPQAIGLAVWVPEEYVKEEVIDDLNYLFVIGKKGAKSITYRTAFCAAMEEDGWSAEKWFEAVKKDNAR